MVFSLCFFSLTGNKVQEQGEAFCEGIFFQSLVVCPFCVPPLSLVDHKTRRKPGPSSTSRHPTVVPVPPISTLVLLQLRAARR